MENEEDLYLDLTCNKRLAWSDLGSSLNSCIWNLIRLQKQF